MWQPLLDLESIVERQDAVQELVEHAILRTDLRAALNGLYDVERLVGRIGFGNANARDMVALRLALERIPGIQVLLDGVQSARLHALDGNLDTDTLARLADLIARAISDEPPILLRDGGLIRREYDLGLEQLQQTADEHDRLRIVRE